MIVKKLQRYIFLLLILTATNFPVFAQSQQEFTLHISALMGKKSLKLNHFYPINSADSILFSSFKCYISRIQFYQSGQLIAEEQESYHLIDFSDEKTLLISPSLSSQIMFDEIQFQLGIDSVTNISGAMGGDLDPTKGMYWSWQSGYINLKLEGQTYSKNGTKEFAYHIGGYDGATNPIQICRFTTQEKKTFTLTFNMDELISIVNFMQQPSIMSPRKEAVELAQKFHAILQLK